MGETATPARRRGYWLTTEAARVLHAVVFPAGGPSTVLCGNRGSFTLFYTPAEDAPDRPVCTRCVAEVERLRSAVEEPTP